jgi:hypothetical protein
MGRTLDEVLQALPQVRREVIEERVEILIAEIEGAGTVPLSEVQTDDSLNDLPS